jgi:hypothetical protein
VDVKFHYAQRGLVTGFMLWLGGPQNWYEYGAEKKSLQEIESQS